LDDEAHGQDPGIAQVAIESFTIQIVTRPKTARVTVNGRALGRNVRTITVPGGLAEDIVSIGASAPDCNNRFARYRLADLAKMDKIVLKLGCIPSN
jgi:hypothetical protein